MEKSILSSNIKKRIFYNKLKYFYLSLTTFTFLLFCLLIHTWTYCKISIRIIKIIIFIYI